MLRLFTIIGFALSASIAYAQPKLTKELGEKVRTGAGTLTEQQVLKLVPGTVTISRVSKDGPGSVDADWLLQWEEATKFEIVLIDGKVTKSTASFSDVAVSKSLTLAAFKSVKEGMSLEDLKKILGSANSQSETVDDMNQKTTRCVWSRGREIRAYVKGDKVNGGGFIDTLDQ